jgi:hypothetical protein
MLSGMTELERGLSLGDQDQALLFYVSFTGALRVRRRGRVAGSVVATTSTAVGFATAAHDHRHDIQRD